MKAVVAAFNQEKALVGAFSVITYLRSDGTFSSTSGGGRRGRGRQHQLRGVLHDDDQRRQVGAGQCDGVLTAPDARYCKADSSFVGDG